MRYIVLLITGIMCRSGTPPPEQVATAPCTMATDGDLLELLRAHDCFVGSRDDSPPQVDVRVVRGTPDADSIPLRVELENRGSAPVPLELVIRDQRLCFELTADDLPAASCELFEEAPAGVDSRARVILQPHVTARVDKLVFRKQRIVERYQGHGVIGGFEERLAPGNYPITVRVPLPSEVILRASVTVP